MRQSGRVNLVSLVGIVIVVVVAIALGTSFLRQPPSAVAGQFLSALAKGDTATLTKLTYRGTASEAQVKEEWDFALKVGKHYSFRWQIMGETVSDEKNASVRTQVWRNFGPGAYEENYGIPMVKENGNWLVDVKAISRQVFPALPRLEASPAK